VTKPPPFTTSIGRHAVPVRGVFQTVVRFRDGHYAFWTAVFKRRVESRWRIIGRAKVGLSAGDRFDRMKRERYAAWIPKEDRPEYAKLWNMMDGGANVRFVRPSTKHELKRWMRAHPVQRGQRA
jgi:hypothetical protein